MKNVLLMFAVAFSVLVLSNTSQAQGWGNGHGGGHGDHGHGHDDGHHGWPGDHGGVHNHDYGRDYVQCDSNGYAYRECGSYQIRRIDRAVLVQQHSKSACVYGSSWGVHFSNIWVNNGCRATFEVSGWRD